MSYLAKLKERSTPTLIRETSELKDAVLPADFKHPAKTQLLAELVKGQQWLARHHELWCNDDPRAANHETFSRVLSEWIEKQENLRNIFDYVACIYGRGQTCPDDAVARCEGC